MRWVFLVVFPCCRFSCQQKILGWLKLISWQNEARPGKAVLFLCIIEDMEFSRVLKKKELHFPGVNQEQCEISRGDQEKIVWNFCYKGLCFKRKIHYPFKWIQLIEWFNYFKVKSCLHYPFKWIQSIDWSNYLKVKSCLYLSN